MHGTQTSLNRVGWVGDFCPFCHDLRPLMILQIGQTSTLYTAPVGRTTTLGYLAYCEQCQAQVQADPSRYLKMHAEPQSMETYLDCVRPAVLNELKARAAIEDRYRRKMWTAEDRLELLQEPLRALEPTFRTGIGHFAMSLRSVVTFGLMIAAFVAPLAGFPSLTSVSPGVLSLALGGISLILLICSLRCDAANERRRLLHPLLASIYSPLSPDYSEMVEAVRQLRDQKWTAGKRLDVDALLADIAGVTSTVPPTSEVYRILLDRVVVIEDPPSTFGSVDCQERLNKAFADTGKQYESVSSIDGYVLAGLLLTFSLIGLLAALEGYVPKGLGDWVYVVSALIIVGALIFDLRLMLTARSRQLRKRFIPHLKRQIYALNASPEQVTNALDYVRSLRFSLGHETHPEDLIES